jgi:hypothetical protein
VAAKTFPSFPTFPEPSARRQCRGEVGNRACSRRWRRNFPDVPRIPPDHWSPGAAFGECGESGECFGPSSPKVRVFRRGVRPCFPRTEQSDHLECARPLLSAIGRASMISSLPCVDPHVERVAAA